MVSPATTPLHMKQHSCTHQQGISWLVRRAIAYSSITIHVSQSTDAAGIVHIEIEQVSTGGFKNNEERMLDWQWREKNDSFYGQVKGRSRWVNVADVEGDAYLTHGWSERWLHGPAGGEVVQSDAESLGKEPPWIAYQVWGFDEIDGGLRHVRRIVAKKGSEVHKVRLVYDWAK